VVTGPNMSAQRANVTTTIVELKFLNGRNPRIGMSCELLELFDNYKTVPTTSDHQSADVVASVTEVTLHCCTAMSRVEQFDLFTIQTQNISRKLLLVHIVLG